MIEKTIIDLEQPPLDQSERTQATPAVARRAAALAGVLLIFVGAILGMSTFQADLSNPESRSLVTLEPVSEDIIDIQAFIDSQVLQGEKHIVIPPGRHYVKPQHHDGKTHLFFRNLRDIVIDGMDMAEIVCTKTTRAITLYNCKNVTLRGLVVDYDPLPYTQGEIVDMSDDKLKLTVSMISGYPKANSIIQQKNIEIYDSTTDELSTLTYYNVGVNVIDQDTVVVTKNAQYAALSQEKVGDIVVFYSANMQNQFPHAVFASDSSDLKFERVKVFASNMFGFLETRCNNSGYVDCSVDRRLPEDDIRERGHRRLRSTNADAFHSKQAAIGPKFNGVTARYNGDDGIAINGDYHIITKISKGPTNTLRIIGKNGKVPDLSEGDDVELVMYSGEKIPSAKIVSFDSQSTYELETAEKDFLSRQRFSGETQLTSFVDKVYMVTLDRSIDVPMGSLIASANRIGNGYRVEDCIVGPLRSRGLLLKAGDGIVTGNTVRDTWLSAIVVEPEYVWLEAGSGDNISITNNVIERSHDVGIKVTARGGDNSIAPSGAHTGIMIADNNLSGCSNPAIAVTSTNGLIMYLNRITEPNNDIVPFWKRFEFGRQQDPARQIYLENISGVASPGVTDSFEIITDVARASGFDTTEIVPTDVARPGEPDSREITIPNVARPGEPDTRDIIVPTDVARPGEPGTREIIIPDVARPGEPDTRDIIIPDVARPGEPGTREIVFP